MLVNTRFQVLFHSPSGVLFTFPSQYFFTIGHRVVFRLGGSVPPYSHRVSRVRRYSGYRWLFRSFRVQDSHLLRLDFPFHSTKPLQCRILSEPRKYYYSRFWPLPRSLATTYGISVDFSSSPYLDVSVQAVPLIYLCIQYMMTRLSSCRIAPFGNLRIKAYLRLPAAYRS